MATDNALTSPAMLNYRTPNERFHDAQRAVALPRTCPTCHAEPGDPCVSISPSSYGTYPAGTPMFLFHPTRTAPATELAQARRRYGRTVPPRERFGRCACGRPINTKDASQCAECD